MTRIEEIKARMAHDKDGELAGYWALDSMNTEKIEADMCHLIAEVKRMREALELIASYCDGGFIKCERCGDQTDMTDCDMHIEARAALKGTQS